VVLSYALAAAAIALLLALALGVRHYRRRLAERERELAVERRKLFHQERMAAVGAMAAGMLHDIGNPIAAIDGVARAMKEAIANGEALRGQGLTDPELILRETARLHDFTRMIAGLAATQSTEPQWLDLNELIRTAVLLLHFDPRLAGARIDTDLDPQLPAVHGVADSLMQLLTNLLVNAADAVRSGRTRQPLIQVKTGVDPAGVWLTIADNGCGMEEAVLRRAFEPMFTTKPAGLGTGLGLPLVRAIAEAHGGSVTIASQPAEGSRVDVHLALQPQVA
jgi:signal transduction histidine kinase